MTDFAADPSHPRYGSLLLRHKLELAAEKGMLAGSALIAHGRGEAFDYLIGEQTSTFASDAIDAALHALVHAQHPIICVNGNVAGLAGEEILRLATLLGCPVEINIFYRTEQRMEAIYHHLDSIRTKSQFEVNILGREPNSRIPNLEGPRAMCEKDGILNSDVILVPLEDGDRCEALRAMGKTVIVIDLNPLSRSSQKASITIVDELTRCISEMCHRLKHQSFNHTHQVWDNTANLDGSLDLIRHGMKH